MRVKRYREQHRNKTLFKYFGITTIMLLMLVSIAGAEPGGTYNYGNVTYVNVPTSGTSANFTGYYLGASNNMSDTNHGSGSGNSSTNYPPLLYLGYICVSYGLALITYNEIRREPSISSINLEYKDFKFNGDKGTIILFFGALALLIYCHKLL
jgi:hypothetical protein